MAIGLPIFGQIDVNVNGNETQLTLGMTVEDAIDQGLMDAGAGNVLNVAGGVVVYGGGEPGTIMLNGLPVHSSTRLKSGDELIGVAGRDVTESVLTTQAVIPIPVKSVGEGPLVALESPGSAGVQEVRCGAISGLELEHVILVEAEPMVLRNYEPTASPAGNLVALTFDDGPWPLHTQQVLEILEREDVKATFFMLGKQVRRNRAMAVRVAEEGHLVGNHSLSHVYLSNASPEVVRSEIENAQDEIEKTIGVRPTWYRPAGGVVSPPVWAQTRASKVRLVKWTVDPQDYRAKSPVMLARNVIDATRPGSIVLLHDGGGDRTVTVKALTTIIRELKSRGYTFVTLDEMFPAE